MYSLNEACGSIMDYYLHELSTYEFLNAKQLVWEQRLSQVHLAYLVKLLGQIRDVK